MILSSNKYWRKIIFPLLFKALWSRIINRLLYYFQIWNKKEHIIDSKVISSHLGAMNIKIIFTNPSARAGYETRSIFKRSLTGLNSEFSFS